MPVDAATTVTVDTVLAVGVPLLVVLFFFEGLIVGKVLQPPAVFVGVVAVAQPAGLTLTLLVAGCVLAVVVGQWLAFHSVDTDAPELVGVRRRVPWLTTLPRRAMNRIGERRVRVIDSIFTRYGGVAIVVTTFLPGIRGLLSVPAGVSSYSTRRFVAASVLGNVVYFPVLVGIAYGLTALLGW